MEGVPRRRHDRGRRRRRRDRLPHRSRASSRRRWSSPEAARPNNENRTNWREQQGIVPRWSRRFVAFGVGSAPDAPMMQCCVDAEARRRGSPSCCLLVLAGCKVDADITVTMKPDGSGTIDTFITLDAEAVARVGGGGRTLDTAFPLDDLDDRGLDDLALDPRRRRLRDAAAAARLRGRERARPADHRAGRADGAAARSEADPPAGRVAVARRARADRRPAPSEHRDPAGPRAGRGAASGRSRRRHPRPAAPERAPRGAVGLGDGEGARGTRKRRCRCCAGEQETATAARSRFNTSRLTWFAIAGILAFLGVLLYLSASIGARRERARRVRSVRQPVERTPLM